MGGGDSEYTVTARDFESKVLRETKAPVMVDFYARWGNEVGEEGGGNDD